MIFYLNCDFYKFSGWVISAFTEQNGTEQQMLNLKWCSHIPFIHFRDPLHNTYTLSLSVSFSVTGATTEESVNAPWREGEARGRKRTAPASPTAVEINDVCCLIQWQPSLIRVSDTIMMLIIIALLITLMTSSIIVIYVVYGGATKTPLIEMCSISRRVQVCWSRACLEKSQDLVENCVLMAHNAVVSSLCWSFYTSYDTLNTGVAGG